MKALSADTFLARLLARLTAAVCRHPRWFLYPQVVLFVVCVLYTIGYLQTDMNRDNLVGPNQKYHQNFLRLQKEFPQQGNDLVVVVESDNTEKNRQFVERLAAKMAAETNLFRDVFYQHDLAMMGTKALLFVPEDDLAGFNQRCTTLCRSSGSSRKQQTSFRFSSKSTRRSAPRRMRRMPKRNHWFRRCRC